MGMVSSTIIIGIEHLSLLGLKGVGKIGALPHFPNPLMISLYPFTEPVEVAKIIFCYYFKSG
jgi:hypothetical protein